MADKSLLSLRGEVNWVTGDYSNVINQTKRLMSTMNSASSAELRAGQREREQVLGQGLKDIEDLESQASERLIKSKSQAAQRLANVGAQARAPPPLPSDAGAGEMKKREREIESILNTGERAHKRLQRLQLESGREARAGASSVKGGLEAYGAQGAGARAADMELRRDAISDIDQEIQKRKELLGTINYMTDRKGYLAEKKAIADLNMERDEHIHTLKEEQKMDMKAKGYEKDKLDTDRKLGESKRKLYRTQQSIHQKTMQMERDMMQINREAAEEIGRMRQEMGEGLTSAFTYATVAVMAFWYKLMPVVETFKEFEAELVNAQSIWQNSQAELNELSDSVVQFGQNFGIEMGKATEGLYQYASAGVEAAEAMQMLNHTLTLSMAVQGDHNTLAKLTTQTIMGFGMEFDQAAEVTDKFAHAINMSLIEWDDLASSIKFALPFFTSTGQSLDQLLGALSVLTNRALEAGIAGRGLRQALAEFAQHADDNSAAFAKMGVEILDAEGNMHQLTDIARQFQDVMGEGVNDMDVMMALMEDLNIRGATAFVHLVQNADEFQEQVDDLQNSAGASAKMAEVQQQSLANQIQLVKNAMQAPFLMSDKIGEAAGYTNEFSMVLHGMVKEFEKLIVVNVNGTKQLTEFGQFIKDFVIEAMKSLGAMLILVRDTIKGFGEEGEAAAKMLRLFTVPLTIVIKLLDWMGAGLITSYLLYSKMTQILPMNTAQIYNNIQARMASITVAKEQILEEMLLAGVITKKQYATHMSTLSTEGNTEAIMKNLGWMMLQKAAMFTMIWATQALGKEQHALAAIIGVVAGAFMGLAIAKQLAFDATSGAFWLTIGGAMAAAALFNTLMYDMMQSKAPEFNSYKTSEIGQGNTSWGATPIARATGGYVYPQLAEGGPTSRSQPYIVGERGPELFIPQSAGVVVPNKDLGGVTINISGDVYDGDNFAQKISEVLPHALRKTTDTGGI